MYVRTSSVCLSLCTACSNGTYGPGCQLSCQCSVHSSGCDHVTGTCSCAPGYQGVHCEMPCPAGRYGPGCSRQCLCDNGARCDHVTGRCACSAGWMGPGCRYPCRPGFWGPGCNQVRHCIAVVIIVSYSIHAASHCMAGFHKKLSYCRETARCFLSLNISLSHSSSFEMTPLSRACVSPYKYSILTMSVSCTVSEIFSLK